MAIDLDQVLNILNAAKAKGMELADLAKEKGIELASAAKVKGDEFAGAAKERGMSVAGLAMEKTKEAAQIAKLSVSLAGEKDALKKAYAELGRMYYEENRAEADGILAQLCEEVEAVNARVEALEAEIADVKAALRSTAETADFEEVVSQDEEGDITVEITEEE